VLSNVVCENGMSFHSTQATSHALHPMHVVVSISLQTVSCRCVSSPGTLPGCALIFCMRSVAWLISAPLRFLDLHQESFEFRCVLIGVQDRRRQLICQSSMRLVFVLSDAAIAPMDGNADLIRLLAGNHHVFDTFGDHRFCNIRATDAGHFHHIAAAYSSFLR